MRTTTPTLLTTLLTLATLSACASHANPEFPADRIDRSLHQSIKPNMPASEVVTLLGQPDAVIRPDDEGGAEDTTKDFALFAGIEPMPLNAVIYYYATVPQSISGEPDPMGARLRLWVLIDDDTHTVIDALIREP